MNQNNQPIQKLVNANLGITNIIEKDEIRTTMMKTFTELADKLKLHCGPYSGTAILSNPNDPMSEPVFTKDGINIVRAITYASPMQDFVRRQLAYMGARIERSAGDGTTSSMIIMAYTLSSLLDYLTKSDYIYSGVELMKTWNTLVERLTAKYEELKKESSTLTDKDTIAFVAASQAYTSSHGDLELAECIGKLFGNTPREVWDTLTIKKAMYESEEKYKVTIDESEYTLDDIVMFPQDRCNEELGTVLNLKNANILIQDSVAVGDGYQKKFHEYVENAIKTGEQLLIVCSSAMDGITREHYQGLFTDNPKHNTIFVMCSSDDATLNDINALSVLAWQNGYDSYDPENIKTFQADVYMEGSTLRFINGLLKGNDHSGLNPYYKNPDYPVYNEFVDKVKTIINREKSDVTRNNARSIRSFIRILHKLVATKDVVFTVGGSAYDNAASQDVAMDALLATKSSLTKGFVAGRCVTLRSVLQELRNESDTEFFSKQKLKDLYVAYINVLLSSIEEVNHALEDSIGYSDNIKKTLEYKDSPADFTRLDDPSYVIPVDLRSAIESKTDYCIIQPAETDLTFIKRFGEIGLKFLTANRVITNGYMYGDTSRG